MSQNLLIKRVIQGMNIFPVIHVFFLVTHFTGGWSLLSNVAEAAWIFSFSNNKGVSKSPAEFTHSTISTFNTQCLVWQGTEEKSCFTYIVDIARLVIPNGKSPTVSMLTEALLPNTVPKAC